MAYGLPLSELAEANGLADPTQVEAGFVLLVPGAKRTLEIPPHPAPLPSPLERTPAIPFREARASGFIWPLPGGSILSNFGDVRRSHRHRGLDIRGAHGQRVLAAASGYVSYGGRTMRGYGNTVILDHGRGFQSLYAHNSRLLVRVGDEVGRGQPIALVGRTGNATSGHCHFEIRRDQVPVDPLLYLPGITREQP